MITLRTLHPEYIINKNGDQESVLLPIQEFNSILESLEELEDLIAIAERRDEETTPHDQLLEELKKDGLLSD